MVEEAAAASHSLAAEADELGALTGRFRVDARSARPNPVHAAQARLGAAATDIARRA
jgi:hypothetical protein